MELWKILRRNDENLSAVIVSGGGIAVVVDERRTIICQHEAVQHIGNRLALDVVVVAVKTIRSISTVDISISHRTLGEADGRLLDEKL